MAKPVTVAVPEELDGERIDRVVAVLGEMSRSEARVRCDDGEVTVDGEVAAAKSRVAAGATVTFPPTVPPEQLAAEPVDFGVVYEDEDLLVVDKPAGLTVHPGAGRTSGTLAGGLMARYPELVGVGEAGRWGLVHRLDRETSGVLLVARTPEAHRSLTDALRRREIGRRYLALVQGTFDLPRGTVDAPIGRDPHRPRRRALVPEGRHAVTHYRMVEQWPGVGVALVSVELETGRTHQIRVHLAGIGHSVIGDRLYGRRDPITVPRLFLHAESLHFVHPRSGEEMTVESPLPPDLVRVLTDLGEAEA
ncbi:MAG TPA: RluA family pseudouridine synthase [Acidimicrobiia bacterium]|nr:RluA family pseudouridine synthase [Acidimicrobiia bacterium]